MITTPFGAFLSPRESRLLMQVLDDADVIITTQRAALRGLFESSKNMQRLSGAMDEALNIAITVLRKDYSDMDSDAALEQMRATMLKAYEERYGTFQG